MTPMGDDLSLRKRRKKKLTDNELAMPFEALFAVTDFNERRGLSLMLWPRGFRRPTVVAQHDGSLSIARAREDS